ncbi:hypothetical protein MD484_g2005, partial [Candolleomyces efflorescens]
MNSQDEKSALSGRQDDSTKAAPEVTVPGIPLTEQGSNDLERASSNESATILPHDPFQLQNGILTDGALEGLRNRKRGKQLEKHHLRQNELIKSMLKPMEEHTEDAHAEEQAAQLPVKIAIYASLYSNFALCVLQLYAAISSGSLSLLSTAIDSVFDIGANTLLWWLHRKATTMDLNKWPVGGARIGTIGNVVYGFLMGTVNLVVVVESISSLATYEGDDLRKFHLPSIIAVGSALGGVLNSSYDAQPLNQVNSRETPLVPVQFLDPKAVEPGTIAVGGSPQRSIYQFLRFVPLPFQSMDENIEADTGILMATGGSKIKWWLDPMGAIIISSGIIASWSRTTYKQFELLAGKSAPHEFLQLIIYKVATFHEEITKVDTVRAYHSGQDYFVEVDIVMDANTPLWKAHDISQELQDKIEVLPNVERAFVHVDYETSHYPEHRKTPKSPI